MKFRLVPQPYTNLQFIKAINAHITRSPMSPLDLTIRAKTYIDKLANGMNPITNEHVTETDSVNNIKVSRALTYISDLLRQIIDYCTVDYSRDPSKAYKGLRPFFLSEEQISRYRFTNDPVYIRDIVNQLNSLSSAPNMRKITYRNLLSYLLYAGYMESVKLENGRTLRRPTAKGLEIGIIQQEKRGDNGSYSVTRYTAPAQHHIINHIYPILAYLATRHVKLPDPNKPLPPRCHLPCHP